MKKYTHVELFAGVGGNAIAFKNTNVETLALIESDKYCCKTLRVNFPNSVVVEDRVENVDYGVFPRIDILTAGFPCQSFSVAGLRTGLKNEARVAIESIFNVVKSHKPKVVFLENVKGLLSSNKGRDFEDITNRLKELGYYVAYKVINAFKAGFTRQIRERVYIVASLEKPFEFGDIKSETQMVDIQDFTDCSSLEYTKEKYPKYFSDSMDLSKIESGKFYQIRRTYIRELANCPTLTCNMGTGGHNVPIIKTESGMIRKLCFRECFELMGFPECFRFPAKVSHYHFYKQAGNSVIVPLVEAIAKKIFEIL